MKNILYIDVLFFENFIIEYVILFLVSFVLNRKFKWLGSIIATLISSLYVCSFYLFDTKVLKSFAIKMIIISLVLFFAFKIRSVSEYIKHFIIFIFFNIFFGGSVGLLLENANIDSKGYLLILISTVLIVIFGRTYFMILKRNISVISKNEKIILVYKNKKIKLNTFLDTGNTLIDPLSHKSVVIVSKKKGEQLINKDNISMIKNFRLIPCKTVNNGYELLYGFKPDKFIYKDKLLDAVVAVSRIDFEGDYDAIINPVTLV